jgi:DNA polymerase-1
VKPTRRVLLIDGDTLVYAAACNSEVSHDWGDGTWSLTANIDEAQSRFRSDIKRILKHTRADDFVLALSCYDHPRWREGVLETYKEERRDVGVRKPLIYEPLRLWVASHPKALTWPSLEGDDILGVLMTEEHPNQERRICVSIDKDMKQIPGWHVNYQNARDVETWREVFIDQDTADRFHMFQTLTGDPVDGYKGCPGVGPKRAEAALSEGESLEEWWPLVEWEYRRKKVPEEEVLKQARVARILRACDYDLDKKEVKLWSPPTQES